MATVTACCWNKQNITTKSLVNYYKQSDRHKRMADYIAGACAKNNLQTVIGHAIGELEDGTSSNWFQLGPSASNLFITFWDNNNITSQTLTATDVASYDAINAAAGVYYFSTLSAGNLGDGGISYKTAMFKAMQYNWGPTSLWTGDRANCLPSGTTLKPSAYAWTMAFLAWGSGYAVSDIRYGGLGASYADQPTWTDQDKYLSPYYDTCFKDQALTVPAFTPTYSRQTSPYGRRSTGKQFVILARTNQDYITGLAAALFLKKNHSGSECPVVTADTYFACDSMKNANTSGNVCVIVVGQAAKTDVGNVFASATAYSSFSAWDQGTTDGYIDVSSGTWAKTRDESVAAHNAGF